jgi:hypothetical protein
MARQRNYTPPTLIVRQHFVNDSNREAVLAYLHISGAHANVLTEADGTKEAGFLGVYQHESPFEVELPLVLRGNVLDRDSVRIYFEKALLHYFEGADTNYSAYTFALPTGSRSSVTNTSDNWSFRSLGDTERAVPLKDRDVKPGDAVRVTYKGTSPLPTAVSDEFWTTVSSFVSHVSPGTAETTATADKANSDYFESGMSYSATTSSDVAGTITPTSATSDYVYGLGQTTATPISITVSDAGANGLVTDGDVKVTITINGTAVITALSVPSTGILPASSGTKGIRLEITDLATAVTTSSTWSATITPAIPDTTPFTIRVANAGFNAKVSEGAAREIIYIISVTQGGTAGGSTPPILSVQTSDGSDKTPRLQIVDPDVWYTLSRLGLEIKVNTDQLQQGDLYYLKTRSPYTDSVPTIILSHNVPNEWVTTAEGNQITDDISVGLDLFLVEENLEIPEQVLGEGVNWTLNLDSGVFELKQHIQLYTPNYTVSSAAAALPVYNDLDNSGIGQLGTSKVYLDGRYFVPDISDTVLLIRSINQLNSEVSGPIDSRNPIKLAAYHALANGSGASVLLTSVADPTNLASWERVTDLISERDDVFHVMPLSYGNTDVDQLFYQHIVSMNDPEMARERVLYLVSNDVRTSSIVTEHQKDIISGRMRIVQATLGSQYLAWEAMTDGVDFTNLGVKTGDTLRTYYDFDASGNTIWHEFTVDSVINSKTLRLVEPVSMASADPVDHKFEVWRTQTNTEFADSIANTGSFQDYLVRYIYTDNASPDFDQYTTASALVGLIASVVPHQGVSWYPLTGFSIDTWKTQFSRTQLDHMAGNGVLLITPHRDGYLCARHAVTTNKAPLAGNERDNLNLKLTEEMYIRNMLLLKKEFRNAITGVIGISNNVPEARARLHHNITMVAESMMASVDYPMLGGRITGMTNLQVRPHAVLADHVWIRLDITGPVPLNAISMDIYC